MTVREQRAGNGARLVTLEHASATDAGLDLHKYEIYYPGETTPQYTVDNEKAAMVLFERAAKLTDPPNV